MLELGTQVFESQEVGIKSATPDFVATGLGDNGSSHASQQRTDHQDGATQVGTFLHELVALQVFQVECVGLERERTLSDFLDLDTDIAQQLNEVVDVANVGDVVDGHLVAGEQRGTDNL